MTTQREGFLMGGKIFFLTPSLQNAGKVNLSQVKSWQAAPLCFRKGNGAAKPLANS